MKSYKELLNKATKTDAFISSVNENDIKALKKCVLEIYKKIAEICETNNLTVMLAGGSCLGAVRHKGFIPWDDDLDVMMPRPDYDRLIDLCEAGALGDRFFFRYPGGKEDSVSMFLKVYYRDSKVVGLSGENSKYPLCCFVDVFPLDGYSKYGIVRRMKGWLANSVRLIANTVLEAGNNINENKVYSTDKNLYRIVRLRRLIGSLFSVISHNKWVRLFDWIVKDDNMETIIGIPTGRKLYNGEVFPAKVYLPPVEAIFEGVKVKIPANYDEYLKNLYRNYMELPPVEKRESHFIVSLNIPIEFYE